MGGGIDAKSEKNRGTSFNFKINVDQVRLNFKEKSSLKFQENSGNICDELEIIEDCDSKKSVRNYF